jgi:aldose 1-epimerase
MDAGELDDDAVKFSIESPDGEMGYPGNLSASVTYRLQGNRLSIDFEATADAPTPVNLVQHNYFNLAGAGEVSDHVLWVNAGKQLIVDDGLIPTGKVLYFDLYLLICSKFSTF